MTLPIIARYTLRAPTIDDTFEKLDLDAGHIQSIAAAVEEERDIELTDRQIEAWHSVRCVVETVEAMTCAI